VHGYSAGREHAPAAAEFPPQLAPSRRAIYRKMTAVGQLPLAQVETNARVDAVRELMERRGDFRWTAFAVFAVARLLRSHGELRTDAATGAPFAAHRIGVAADTPGGLIVPVVRDADSRSLSEVELEIVRLARAGPRRHAEAGRHRRRMLLDLERRAAGNRARRATARSTTDRDSGHRSGGAASCGRRRARWRSPGR